MDRATADALYVHTPFCVVKCPYCDFYSLAGHDDQRGRFLDALEAEAEYAARDLLRGNRAPDQFATVFIGGGTPSFLTCAELERLGAILQAHFPLGAVTEFTVEANPNSLSAEKACALRAIGANRLSLGAQSFDASRLAWLGRAHTPDEIIRAHANAREAGFENLSLDLLFGVPGQTADDFARDLDQALALGIEHLSLYGLTYEPGTPLHAQCERGAVVPAPEAVELQCYETAETRLASAGFTHYEISNFARPGRECRHNLTYWTRRPYVGLGPGAHSFDGRTRWGNRRSLSDYIAAFTAPANPAAARDFQETLSPLEHATEHLLLGLRLVDGIDLQAKSREVGVDLHAGLAPVLPDLTAKGWVTYTGAVPGRNGGGSRLSLTRAGRRVADRVILALAVALERAYPADRVCERARPRATPAHPHP